MRTITLFFILPLASLLNASDLPNIVIFLADDHSLADSSVYGSPDARTPMMQSLADEGLVFNTAFVASPACGPSRSALMSGLMPARNGAEGNHEQPRPETQVMVKQLKKAGYEVVALGKVHHGKDYAKLCGFDFFDHRPTNLAGKVKAYLDARESDKPLCLLVGDRRPHVKWTKEMHYDPESITLPDHFIDTPETRRHWARYLTDITGMDDEMRQVDQLVSEYFGNKDYLFMYTADHGGQWPFAKWNLYDAGINVPMIVRWPGMVEPGRTTDAIVSWIDIFPTLLELAKGEVPEGIDGRSFANVLSDPSDSHREILYTTHNADKQMNIYPIRSIRTERYKFIRNLNPETYHSNHSDINRFDGAGLYWHEWDEAAKESLEAREIIRRYYQREPVELFDLKNDPLEQTNLATDPEYADLITDFQKKLDQWMAEQGDTVRLEFAPFPLDEPTPYEVIKVRRAQQKDQS